MRTATEGGCGGGAVSAGAPAGRGFVVGFLFDTRLRVVAVILKNKPDWMKGRWNGIGGHVEPGETPEQAMVREFWEETGLEVPLYDPEHAPDGWQKVAVVQGGGATENDRAPYEMTVFAAKSSRIREVRNVTDECVDIMETETLSTGVACKSMIRPWLALLALNFLAGGDRNKFYTIQHT